MAGTAVSGNGGSIKIDDFVLGVKDWSGDFEQTLIETTDSDSGGFQEGILGIKKLTGSANAIWKVSSGSVLPFNMVQPQQGVEMELPCGTTGGKYTGLFNISKMGIKCAYDGAIEFSLDYSSTGEFGFE